MRRLLQSEPDPDFLVAPEFITGLRLLPRYEASARVLAAQAAALRARGARVYFVMMPESGLVKEMDDRWFPRAQFWDRFVRLVGTPALHFEDVPAMRSLVCPDGSHLDYRERRAFTAALAEALRLAPGRPATDL